MKTRVVLFVRSCLAVLAEHRLVSDGRTDTGPWLDRGCIASRGKKMKNHGEVTAIVRQGLHSKKRRYLIKINPNAAA